VGDRRFFLTYVPAAPHYPYEKVPAAFHKFSAGEMGDCTPFYLNDLLYMDWVVASIVDQLKESGLLERTLVVITDDHGEMLGANKGPIGHGWLLTPELANAPLIIMDPQKPGYHVNPSVGSQVDLLPTLLDRLGIPIPQDQLYEGRSLEAGEGSKARFAYLNTFQQYAVLCGNEIIMGDRLEDDGHAGRRGRAAYTISNEGSKTLFTVEPRAAEKAISMRKFDEFQASLLRNYSFYCDSVLAALQERQVTSAK
jgi:arylsulfatase A-like enzyme